MKKNIKHCQAFVREIIKNGKEDVTGNTSKGPSNEWISFLKRHPRSQCKHQIFSTVADKGWRIQLS